MALETRLSVVMTTRFVVILMKWTRDGLGTSTSLLAVEDKR